MERCRLVRDRQQLPQQEQDADPDDDRDRHGTGCDRHVRDQRRARLRARDDVGHPDDRAQRSVEQPEQERAEDRRPGRQPGEQPRPARRAVPQLGEEVREGEEQERQGGVVVVLEGGPVDARPRDPLDGEADRDEGERRAPPLERLPTGEGQRRDAEPPRHQVARVVDRGGRLAGEALLVEPHGLQVERPRPPRR